MPNHFHAATDLLLRPTYRKVSSSSFASRILHGNAFKCPFLKIILHSYSYNPSTRISKKAVHVTVRIPF